MALRKPLTLVAGQIQQLQPGDTLDAPQSGGDVMAQVNDESTALVICTVVYNDANDGVKRAQANASGTKDAIGIVKDATVAAGGSAQIVVSGLMTATTAQWDAFFGTTGGLTKGTRYYLSATSTGQGTATAPSTAGQYVIELGIALSTTELKVGITSPILL